MTLGLMRPLLGPGLYNPGDDMAVVMGIMSISVHIQPNTLRVVGLQHFKSNNMECSGYSSRQFE